MNAQQYIYIYNIRKLFYKNKEIKLKYFDNI